MVDDVRLAPLRSLDGAVRSLYQGGVQQKVVELVISKLRERLLSKRLDTFEIGQLQGQKNQAVRGGVVLQLVKGLLGPCCVARPEDEAIRFRLCEKLLD